MEDLRVEVAPRLDVGAEERAGPAESGAQSSPRVGLSCNCRLRLQQRSLEELRQISITAGAHGFKVRCPA